MIARFDFPDAAGMRLRLAFGEPQSLLVAVRLEQVTAVVAEADRRARAGAWVAGFVAYEAAPAFDNALRVGPAAGVLPLAWFAVFERPDATAQEAAPAAYACGPWRMTMPRTSFDTAIARIRHAIGEGAYYQVNLSTRLRAGFAGDGNALFAALCQAQPDGYCAALDGGAWQLLSVSPELFFDWRPGSTLRARPMKGTAPRQAEADADAASADALLASAKERAENLMIVDLLRNDLARVAVTGSVQVPQLFAIEALPSAWQMTSTIECTARPATELVDVFAALFPCGSVTGAPKAAAMAAIADLEAEPRGAYCGAIGLIRPGGHATFSVGIRSVVIDRRTGVAECGVGSGITYDSTAVDEFAEWFVKRRFLLRATAGFELIETLRLADGAYWLRDGHMARMAASAAHFGFAWDAKRVATALDDIAAGHALGIWRVRLLLGRAGLVHVEAAPLEPDGGNLAVVLAQSPVDEEDEFLRHKTTARATYQVHAPPAAAFDALLWNRRGEITEFTRGNVVIELDGRRLTPPVECGLLPGVLRGDMLARGEIATAVVRKDDLARCSGLWFINSLRGAVPVAIRPTPEIRCADFTPQGAKQTRGGASLA